MDALAGPGDDLRVQRVHGDLHLRQVMRSADGCLLLDFEGEPGSPITQRIAPDHPLHDVAGMLRSIAYAAAQGGRDADAGFVAGRLADGQAAFREGYAAVASQSPGQPGADSLDAILAAYLVDEAAYEAAHARRYRPDWLHIPMAALRDWSSSAAGSGRAGLRRPLELRCGNRSRCGIGASRPAPTDSSDAAPKGLVE
jgi:maltokinase